MDLKQKIKDICVLPNGVDLVGFSSCQRFSDLPQERRPDHFFPEVKSVIVLGSQVFKILTDRLTTQKTMGEVSFRDFYDAHNEAVTFDLKQTAYRVARFLTNQGYPSINVGQDLTDYRTICSVFPFKYAALKAGMGTTGRNGLLLTPAYGPRVKLGVVLTEAMIEEDPLLSDSICNNCDMCIDTCPSGALKLPLDGQFVNYDRFVCHSFLTANGGCGLCMSACPL